MVSIHSRAVSFELRFTFNILSFVSMIKSIHYVDDFMTASFSCPKPCPNLALPDDDAESSSLGFDIGIECQKTFCHYIRPSTVKTVKSPLPLFSRLCQAAFLLELSMEDSFNPPAENMPAGTGIVSNLDEAINRLASCLLGDRDQGFHVNCSVLGLCVRSVLKSSSVLILSLPLIFTLQCNNDPA